MSRSLRPQGRQRVALNPIKLPIGPGTWVDFLPLYPAEMTADRPEGDAASVRQIEPAKVLAALGPYAESSGAHEFAIEAASLITIFAHLRPIQNHLEGRDTWRRRLASIHGNTRQLSNQLQALLESNWISLLLDAVALADPAALDSDHQQGPNVSEISLPGGTAYLEDMSDRLQNLERVVNCLRALGTGRGRPKDVLGLQLAERLARLCQDYFVEPLSAKRPGLYRRVLDFALAHAGWVHGDRHKLAQRALGLRPIRQNQSK